MASNGNAESRLSRPRKNRPDGCAPDESPTYVLLTDSIGRIVRKCEKIILLPRHGSSCEAFCDPICLKYPLFYVFDIALTNTEIAVQIIGGGELPQKLYFVYFRLYKSIFNPESWSDMIAVDRSCLRIDIDFKLRSAVEGDGFFVDVDSV